MTALFTRDSAFSYTCGRCTSCCHGRRVYVNPFEVARLAQAKQLSTAELIESCVDEKHAMLKHKEQGACVFLDAGSCSVHADRPLACRLYPLARRKDASGTEQFAPIPPEPDTKGEYGSAGTVGTYLTGQQTEVFEKYADRYFEYFSELARTSLSDSANLMGGLLLETLPIQQRLLRQEQTSALVRSILDLDRFFAEREGSQKAAPATPEERADRQLAILKIQKK